MTFWKTLRRSRYLIPVLLILLSAAFRLIDLGTMRYGYDESYQAYLALRLLDGGEFLLIGQPSSVFLDNPPLMAYLQAIPLFFWRSPWAVYLFVTILNSLATGFVYEGTRKVLGNAAAFLAAFLFAINPWLAYYSRLPWTQGLLPFFMAIIAWGLWPTLVTDKAEPRRFFVALLAVIAMMQTYIMAFAILVPVGLLLLLFYRRLPRRPLVAAGLLLTLSLLIYAGGVLTRADQNTDKAAEFVTTDVTRLRPQAVEHAIRFVTGWDFNGQEPRDAEPMARPALMVVAHFLLGLGLLGGGMRALQAMWLRQNAAARRLAFILLIWFGLPTVSLTLLPTLVHPHYLLLTLPAGHVLAAWGLAWGWSRPQTRWLLPILLILIAGQFGWNMRQVAEQAAAAPGGSGTTSWALLEADRLGREIRRAAAGLSLPYRMIAPGQETAVLSGLSGRYLGIVANVSYPDFILLPGQEPLIYLFINQTWSPELFGPQMEYSPERAIHLVDGTQAELVRVNPYSREEALALPENPVDWTSDAGLTLLGYDLAGDEAGTHTLWVTAYWRVRDLHPDRGAWFVSPFYHLLNGQGQIVVNISTHGQWGYRWQLGDVYVERVTLTLPEGMEPGGYELAIGLHDPIHSQSFMLNSPESQELFYRLPVEVAP